MLDPDTEPDRDAWLALEESERIEAAAAAHESLDDALHSEVRIPHIHHVLHATVETHVATGDPAATGDTLRRLTDEGMRRHAAVHMIAEVLMHDLATGTAFEPASWSSRLGKLDAAAWISERMVRHLSADET